MIFEIFHRYQYRLLFHWFQFIDTVPCVEAAEKRADNGIMEQPNSTRSFRIGKYAIVNMYGIFGIEIDERALTETTCIEARD